MLNNDELKQFIQKNQKRVLQEFRNMGFTDKQVDHIYHWMLQNPLAAQMDFEEFYRQALLDFTGYKEDVESDPTETE